MKKLEIVIRPEKLEELKQILNDYNVSGLMITNVMGYGKQKGYVQIYRGTQSNVNLLPKLKVETVVSADAAEKIIDRILKDISTGNIGDGKIFVYQVEEAIRIRTGETGDNALE
jgi:nitrogen regulatory protein P-II 1